MGGTLAAELEDWSIVPTNHPGMGKTGAESDSGLVFRRTEAIFAPSNHPRVAKIQRRVNGIQIPLTLRPAKLQSSNSAATGYLAAPKLQNLKK